MTTIDFMTKRLGRLIEARKSLEEGKILLEMREKDGETVNVDRQTLMDAIEANETAQQNTVEAIKQLEELNARLATE